MSVAELSERVRELEAAFGMVPGGTEGATYSDRLLMLFDHLDVAATAAREAADVAEQVAEQATEIATGTAEGKAGAPDEAATETIEGQLARLQSLFGDSVGVGDEPIAATIEEAVAAIASTLNINPDKG